MSQSRFKGCWFAMCVFMMCTIGIHIVDANHFAMSKQKGHELSISQEMSKERMMADKLLHVLMDVADEYFKGIGASEGELKELGRKRAIITRCYFQAIACY